MRSLTGFEWRAMAAIYLKSVAATLATVAPLLIVYARWKDPAAVDFPLLAATALAGCLCWLATILVIRHPVREEVLGMVAALREGLSHPLGLRS